MESLDYDDYNGNVTQEFPYWQPLVAIDIILYLAVILPSTLFWNLTVFTAFIKSKLGNKPLTVLYSSLLLMLCVDKIGQCIITVTVSPDLLSCTCNIIAFSIANSFGAFSTVFSVLIITCQSLLQLQIIRGKKQWNSYRRIIPCIGVSFLAGMFWFTVLLIPQILLPASSNPCQPLCIQNTTLINSSDPENISLGAYVVSTLLPASVIVIATSVWSVQLFKKMSVRQKIQEYRHLNRKLLLMPILMVFIILCNGLLGYLIGTAFSEVLKLAGVKDYLGNWANFAEGVTFAFISCLQGVSYPITLLYFNTRLRKNWREQLCTRKSNRVHSEMTIITVVGNASTNYKREGSNASKTV